MTTTRLPLSRLKPSWLIGGVVVLGVAVLVGALIGPAEVSAGNIFGTLLDRVFGIQRDVPARQAGIIWEIRLPRVVLGLLVGGMLAVAGGSYQGVFRNPLADPYLLGAAAGAGLGATIAIVLSTAGGTPAWATPAAFVGALGAVGLATAIGSAADGNRSTATLLLAGIAVASFLTAIQTFILQRRVDTVQQVYSWILGRVATTGWSEVWQVLPYTVVCVGVLFWYRRSLDVLAVGDDVAETLGINARRTRLMVVVFASLATAAAVSVSGLIGFVGLVIPHMIRLVSGPSYRVILPLAFLGGGAFLVLADTVARQAFAPAEIPIGVVTAFVGAPFFMSMLLRGRKSFT
ncbi:MAG: iron ABC transporter permease [Acidimicrobiia bacterium]|nr:iron ABC transporter permease [Acidimicrobiia bacterium]NNC43063.1 iron ABC transporter permease [Acidimicrobiia bacterium]NND13272.1 iron ABC transporter permease [Acidimicrobiia bacterium]